MFGSPRRWRCPKGHINKETRPFVYDVDYMKLTDYWRDFKLLMENQNNRILEYNFDSVYNSIYQEIVG